MVSEYSERRRRRGGTIVIDRKEADARVEGCLKRCFSKKEREAYRPFLQSLVYDNAIPMELLESVPQRAGEVGKTRFDQIYDAAMYLAFPNYDGKTLEKLFGPEFDIDGGVKIWRAMFPDKYGISHVVMRASSYQQAFALACDYACRMSLRCFGRIPADLTIRVAIMTEKSVRRMLQIRWANRATKRRKFQLIGRVYSPKEVMGARTVALGRTDDPDTKIFRYAEVLDLQKVLKKKGLVRVSAIDAEVRRKDRFGTVTDQIMLGKEFNKPDPDEEEE